MTESQAKVPAVSVVGVSKMWGPVSAFSDVSFDVPSGEVVALLGPSGAGKSTILRCINHLETISSGRIYVQGDLIGYRQGTNALYELSDTEISRQRERIGMVFQHFNLFRHMTALQNVMCGPVHVLRRPKSEVVNMALGLLDKVGLKAKADAYPWMLRVPVLFSDAEVRQTNVQHRRILEALVRRDEEGAEKAAREHVEATMAIVEPAIQI